MIGPCGAPAKYELFRGDEDATICQEHYDAEPSWPADVERRPAPPGSTCFARVGAERCEGSKP